MSTKASARTFFSAFHAGGIDLHPYHLLDRARAIILHGYDGMSRCLARAAHGTATPEPTPQELQYANGSPEMEPGSGPQSHIEQAAHNPSTPNQDTLEAGILEGAGHPTAGGEDNPVEADPVRSRYTQIWMASFIIGILTLIVTPGLVLGFVTGQLMWGIALSGAIATVVSFLAGLYYHLSK